MELHFPLIFTSVLFLFMVVIRFRSKIQNRYSKLPPAPWKLPIIGHLHHFLGPHQPQQTLKNLAMKHGPLMLLHLGEVPTIIASSPRVAKEILKENDIILADRGEAFAGKIITYGGIGVVFSPYGGRWRQLRKICILELLSAKKVQSFTSVREEEVANLVESVLSMAGCTVNLSKMILSLTNDITCRAAFGEKCKEKEIFLTLLKEVIELSGAFQIPDFFPSYKFLHGIGGVKLKLEKAHQKMNKILDDIVNEHRKNRKGKMQEDLTDVLLRLQEDDLLEFSLENDCIKCVIFEMFLAGSETSSVTLEWAFSELLKNPRIMEKAQSEVRHILHGKEKVGQSERHQFNYLSLVIKETLRLHPPVPLLLPRESRDRCEIDGYEIAKGTKVFVNAWALGRDPEYWSDAETFKPERFQDVSVDYNGTNFEFIPFGAGRRICPGISFGVANIEFPLAQLLYHFNWKLPNGINPEELDMTERLGGILGRKSNLFLIPTPAYLCL